MKITEDNLKLTKAQFLLKLKGYSPAPRNRYLLVINGVLNETEFFLYDFILLTYSDWDIRHLTHGIFEYNCDILAHLIHWNSSKLRRIFGSLIKKNLVRQFSGNKYHVTGYELRESFTKKGFHFYLEIINLLNKFSNTSFNSENNHARNNQE